MKLSGKIAIVTGAGSGIGRATAQRCAAEGAQVLCCDVANADATASGIGDAAAAYAMDVREPAAWEGAVAEAKQRFGDVDLLANIAGVVAKGDDTALGQDLEDWERIISINLKGPWLGMRAVLPTMLQRGSGVIVNIASEAAIIGIPGLLAYTASKGGIAALTRQVAIEYVRQGVTVNAIAPGFIRTAIQDGIEQSLLDDMAAGIPIGRFGAPEDIAASIAHLFSADGQYITGQVIAVDGGWGVA
ncbi:SDR family NAD(P)-dependent oxidoreductase [Conexibacter sp. CPCC 206217]|uniref:SDR family NAD(P)-dependent oxidoreductase n=1 Tax=Conexibacter sp. CPCC 206217 TaxID=3064574 RepID=UPI002726460A|nr:SDR family oxidoreductase [Conexibacter sp. CPCC 206217]MDO8212598.1 SDR family oxidoreductase [Conexibacter sp. CPCC 206217]